MSKAALDGLQNGCVTYPLEQRTPLIVREIDVRCRVIWAAIETYIPVTQIVCQNYDDIRLPRLCQRQGEDQSTGAEYESQKKFSESASPW